VLAIDRFAPGHELGSSHGTERIFRYAYTDPCFVELAIDARPRWSELEALAGEQLLIPTGGVDFGTPSHLDALAEVLAAHDLPFERFDAPAARSRVPAFDLGTGALLQPGAAAIRAHRALLALRRVAESAGARFVDDDGVTAIGVEDSGVVVETTGKRTARGRVAVVTAGAWAEPLLAPVLAPLQMRLPPITVTQEQVAFFRPRSGFGDLRAFIADGSPPVYGLPTPDGLVKIAEHGSGPVVEADHRTFTVEPSRWRALLEWVAAHVPGVDPEPVDARTCLYASVPDDRFVLDRAGPVVIGAGLGGHGFKFLPSIGARLADLADGITRNVNPFAMAGRS
jgi:sarcosine oxidase